MADRPGRRETPGFSTPQSRAHPPLHAPSRLCVPGMPSAPYRPPPPPHTPPGYPRGIHWAGRGTWQRLGAVPTDLVSAVWACVGTAYKSRAWPTLSFDAPQQFTRDVTAHRMGRGAMAAQWYGRPRALRGVDACIHDCLDGGGEGGRYTESKLILFRNTGPPTTVSLTGIYGRGCVYARSCAAAPVGGGWG